MKLQTVLIALAVGFVVFLLAAVLDSTVIIEIPSSEGIFELSSTP